MIKLIKNIKDSYKYIPYTLKHREKLLELQLNEAIDMYGLKRVD